MAKHASNKTIYELEIGEWMDYRKGHWAVERVPGGWMFFNFGNSVAAFVPFSREGEKAANSDKEE